METVCDYCKDDLALRVYDISGKYYLDCAWCGKIFQSNLELQDHMYKARFGQAECKAS